MKKNMKRIVTLVLCAVMALGLLAVSASAENDVSKVKTVKTVSDNGNGTYKVKLEAWAEDDVVIKSETAYQPLDIVIAMDVSDTMNTYINVGARDNLASVDKLDKEYGSNINVYRLKDGMALDHNQRMQYNPALFLPEKFTNYNGANKDTMGDSGWYYMAWQALTGADDTDHDRGNNGWLPLEYAYAEKDKGIQIKKIDAEKIAVQNFLNDLEGKAAAAKEKNGVDYRVSVVQYAANDQGNQGDTASGKSNIVIPMGLVNSSNVTAIKSKVITQSAFTDAPSGWAVNNNTARVTKGDDYLDQGLIQAQNAFDSSSAAKKILILFSSGEYKRGAEAVTVSQSMDGVTIYTVAIGTENSGNLKDIANGGAHSATYANDLNDKLDAIFAQIESTTTTGGDNTSLDANTVLSDTITEYFQLSGTTATVHTERYTATGFVNNNDATTFAISGDTVSYSGFNYSENWVGTTDNNGAVTYHGAKLVIEFDIAPKAGFLGGDGVPTNVTASSGMYYNSTLVKNFNHCTTNVPVKTVSVSNVNDKNVYLLGGVTADQMKTGVTIKAGTVTIDPDAANYGLASWQNEFVDISVTTTDTAKTNLAVDTTYSVSCTVASKTNEATNKSTASASANILVFKPVLTYSDEIIYLSQSPTLTPTSTAWKHGETASTAVTMLGSAPALDLTYKYTDFSDCRTDMNIATAKIGTTDVTTHVTCDNCAVHVLKPTLTASDVTIYRGKSVTLGNAMGTVTWADTVDSKTAATTGTAPTVSYDYKVTDTSAEVPAKPENCTSVTAMLKLGGAAYSDYTTTFTVHVLQPSFTVNTNDAWADCGVAVDLAANCVSYTAAWSDGSHTSVTEDDVSGKPSVDTASTAFTYGAVTGLANGVYTVGESDQTINVTGLNYKFSNGLTGSVAYTGKSFTVHVNTFDLTITKKWSGADSYKQDVILTITRTNGGSYSGGETLRVVIPKGESSVKIAGLLCGQRYQVKEETGWSWRWKPESESLVVSGRGAPKHDHKTIYTLAPDSCSVELDFTNNLRNTATDNKTQWLSGSDYVDNRWTGTAWSNGKSVVQALLSH